MDEMMLTEDQMKARATILASMLSAINPDGGPVSIEARDCPLIVKSLRLLAAVVKSDAPPDDGLH
jgi:hypothetical protein